MMVMRYVSRGLDKHGDDVTQLLPSANEHEVSINEKNDSFPLFIFQKTQKTFAFHFIGKKGFRCPSSARPVPAHWKACPSGHSAATACGLPIRPVLKLLSFILIGRVVDFNMVRRDEESQLG
jgi:hypothetical protein